MHATHVCSGAFFENLRGCNSKLMNRTFQRKRWHLGLLLVLSAATLVACRKNLEEVTADDWRPIFALPIAETTFGVDDILAGLDSSLTPYGNQGQLALTYTGEVFSLDLDSVLTLEPQIVSLGHTLSASDAAVVESGSVVTFPVTLEYGLDTDPEGVRVDEALLLAGSLIMDVDFTTGEDLTAILEIPQLLDGFGYPYTLFIDASAGDLYEDVNLAGYSIIPDHPEDEDPNQITVEAQVTIENNPDYVSQEGDGFEVEVTLTDLQFQHVIGDFGNLEIAVDEDSLEVSVFSNTIEVDDFGFDEIFVDLIVTNSFGIPALLDVGAVESENLETGEIIPLTLDNDLMLQGQASLTSPPEQVVFSIDHTNSNLTDMITPAPQEVRFSGVAIANPDGPPSEESPNFITAGSSIDVDVEVTLPLAGYVNNLTLRDTLAASLDLDLGENVDSVEFRLFTANTFPLGGEVQVIFLDAGFQPLDSLFAAPEFLIAPAPVGADGFPNMSGDVEHFVTLDGVRVDAIRETEHVIIRSTVNTTNSDAETVVTFDESATVEVKLGAKIYARAEL